MKFLLFPVVVLSICSNTYSMEDIKEKTNNTINTNNQHNNDNYMHIFDEDYNKKYYNQLSNQYIQKIASTKPEYEKDIKKFADNFDMFAVELDDTYYLEEDSYSFDEDDNLMSQMSRKIKIPIQYLIKFAKLFDSFYIDNKYNNNDAESNLKKYISNIGNNKLITFKEFYNYIKNNVNKLKTQTLKAIEDAIFHDNDNINHIIDMYSELRQKLLNSGNNKQKAIKTIEAIIKKTVSNSKYSKTINKSSQVLHDVLMELDDILSIFNTPDMTLLSDATKLSDATNTKILDFIFYLRCNCEKVKKYIYKLDTIQYYYYGSTFQKRFDALHEKIISTLSKLCESGDIVNNHQNLRQELLNIITIFNQKKEIIDDKIMNQIIQNHRVIKDPSRWYYNYITDITHDYLLTVYDLHSVIYNNNFSILNIYQRISNVIKLFSSYYLTHTVFVGLSEHQILGSRRLLVLKDKYEKFEQFLDNPNCDFFDNEAQIDSYWLLEED